jgi:hypothetical protein
VIFASVGVRLRGKHVPEERAEPSGGEGREGAASSSWRRDLDVARMTWRRMFQQENYGCQVARCSREQLKKVEVDILCGLHHLGRKSKEALG